MLYIALFIVDLLVHYRLFAAIDNAVENTEKRLANKLCFVSVLILRSFIDQLKPQLQLYPKAPTLSAPKILYWVGNSPRSTY